MVADVTEHQITSWRDLPSLVVAREGEDVVKISLSNRFQEAIDEAAMRLGETDAAAYLDGWSRSPWTSAPGTPAEVAATVAATLEERWSDPALAAYLESL